MSFKNHTRYRHTFAIGKPESSGIQIVTVLHRIKRKHVTDQSLLLSQKCRRNGFLRSSFETFKDSFNQVFWMWKPKFFFILSDLLNEQDMF